MNTEMRISRQSTLSSVLTIGCMNKYFITSFGTNIYAVLMSFVHSQNLLFPCGLCLDAFNHTRNVAHGQKDTNREMIRNNRKTKHKRILLHMINSQLDNNCKFECMICSPIQHKRDKVLLHFLLKIDSRRTFMIIHLLP